MSFNYSPKTVTDGLVLCLDAANTKSYPGSGTTWNDLSKSVNNGTLVNGPTFTTGSSGGIVFDGSNDYVSASDNTTLRPTIFTIDTWFKATSYSSLNVVLTKPFNGPPWSNPYLSYMIRIESSGTVLNCATNNGSYQSIATSQTFTAGVVYNISFTYNSSTGAAVVYLNGSQINSGTLGSGTISYSTLPFLIGGGNGGSVQGVGENFAGTIYSVKLYNKALTAVEITQNYNTLKRRFGL